MALGAAERRARLHEAVEIEEHAARAMLRMGRDLLGRQHRLDAHVTDEDLLPFVARLGLEDRLHLGAHARLRRGVADQFRQIDRPADRLIERGPELRLERADREEAAVPGAVDAVAGDSAIQDLAAAPGRYARGVVVAEVGNDERQRALAHRHVDLLAAPAALAFVERGQDADGAEERAPGDVGQLDRQRRRRTIARPRQAEHAAERQVVQIVPRLVAQRPILPVAADRQHDQLRVPFRQLRPSNAQPLGDTRPEVLDHDIRDRCEAPHQLRRSLDL